MKRRDFITFLGGAAAAWPLVAWAQQPGRVRRVGVLMAFDENDPEARAYLAGFMQGLAELGWTDGSNLRMDVRWGAGNIDRIRMSAKELLDLQPDVILAHGTPPTATFQRETRTIPIVFASVSDPVGEGFVASLARPSGNITGFTSQEAAMAGKWLELLTVIAPGIKRVAAIFNPDTAPGGGLYVLPAFEAAARSFKVALITAPIHSDAEIETFITSLGREPGGGLVMRDATLTARGLGRRSNQVRCPVTSMFVPTVVLRASSATPQGLCCRLRLAGSISTFTRVALSRSQRRGGRGECQSDSPKLA